MEKKKILELAKKLGMNQEAMENQIKDDPKKAETIVTESAKFMGVNNAK